jgi:8-oxo-dGTP pyrophosphatase MutT (NUDIX family)
MFQPQGEVPDEIAAHLVPIRIDSIDVGWVLPGWLERLLQAPSPFRLEGDSLRIESVLQTFASRNAALARWTDDARQRWNLPGWRDERVVLRDGERPILSIERALLRPLGMVLRSAQANVWCMTAAGPLLWVARRAQSKPVEPGKLDALVGGGIAGFDDARSTLIRECQEEAGIAAHLAQASIEVGSIGIAYVTEYDGLAAIHREQVELFDLQLPPDFIPLAMDGEHEAIMPMIPEEAMASISRGGWTREGATATLDLIRRQGWLPQVATPP